jgi:hypothetical protein
MLPPVKGGFENALTRSEVAITVISFDINPTSDIGFNFALRG